LGHGDNLLSKPQFVTAFSIMASDVVWEIAEGFPHGGVYRGHAGVFDDFLARLKADFSDWAVTIAEIIDAGDVVIGLGSYQAQARATGIRVNVPFALMALT
jgi:ketosteroid isomerase-like protein